jgi:hypothetical protein
LELGCTLTRNGCSLTPPTELHNIMLEVHAGWCPSWASNPAGLPMVDRSVRFRHTSANLFEMSPTKPPKPEPFRAEKEVKRRARLAVGVPPASVRYESPKRKPPKHKKRELDLVE